MFAVDFAVDSCVVCFAVDAVRLVPLGDWFVSWWFSSLSLCVGLLLPSAIVAALIRGLTTRATTPKQKQTIPTASENDNNKDL